MNLCEPSARTADVTRPPFTKISKFPEPALDPSTKILKNPACKNVFSIKNTFLNKTHFQIQLVCPELRRECPVR